MTRISTTPSTTTYERELYAFLDQHPNGPPGRPWLLYIGADCPAEPRGRIDRRIPATGVHVFGLSDEDARAVAGVFMEEDAADAAFASVEEDRSQEEALGLVTHRYLACDASGIFVGMIVDDGPADPLSGLVVRAPTPSELVELRETAARSEAESPFVDAVPQHLLHDRLD
jgi:hypothetical protein